jgi:uncharacterized membrane protein (DUF485 family)
VKILQLVLLVPFFAPFLGKQKRREIKEESISVQYVLYIIELTFFLFTFIFSFIGVHESSISLMKKNQKIKTKRCSQAQPIKPPPFTHHISLFCKLPQK